MTYTRNIHTRYTLMAYTHGIQTCHAHMAYTHDMHTSHTHMAYTHGIHIQTHIHTPHTHSQHTYLHTSKQWTLPEQGLSQIRIIYHRNLKSGPMEHVHVPVSIFDPQ